MTTKEIMSRLKAMGNEGIKNIYKKHGAPDNHYGVKIEDLQKIRKQIKKKLRTLS